MMNQHLENWLLADDPQHGSFSMGLANIELKRGAASSVMAGLSRSGVLPSGKNEAVDLEESIFAFSKAPDEQIGHVRKGGSTGAKIRLEPPEHGSKGRVLVSLGENETSFDVAENLGREVKIDNLPFTLKIEDYWPDFRIENGKPRSVTDQANNPAVLVTISGKAVPASAPTTENPHGEMPTTSGPAAMPPAGAETPNRH